LDRYPGGGLIIVNNESIMKSLVKYLLAGIALLSGSFVEVSAQDSTGEDKFVVNKKSAEYDYSTRMGTLTLESYVTGYVKQTRVAVPADICLVLDFSSSMHSTTKDPDGMDLLVSAVGKFIDTIAASAARNDVEHRISIVTFATNAVMESDFISVKNNTTNVNKLKTIVQNGQTASYRSGSTRYDAGMFIARNVMLGSSNLGESTSITGWPIKSSGGSEQNMIGSYSNNGSTYDNPIFYIASTYTSYVTKQELSGARVGVAKFCVLFTDGAPTGGAAYYNNIYKSNLDYSETRYESVENMSGEHGQDYAVTIAVKAVQFAKELKDSGVKVYSIQLDKVKTAHNATNLQKFAEDALYSISSKYPGATRFLPAYQGTASTDTEPYYQHVLNLTDSLSIAFGKISSSIEEVISAKYGEETLMKDFINNAYFSLPTSISADADPWSYIRVFDVKCTGVGADGKTREFETTRHYEYSKTGTTSKDTIMIVVNRATSSHPNDEIIIYGFSYSNNWCGTYNGTPHGYKLEVEVPFEFTGGTTVPGEVMTNAEGSGIYPAEQDENGNVIYDPVTGLPVYDDDPDEPYTPPTITFCTLEIVREGLDRGESAIYEITCNGVSVGRVSLNGTDDPSVSKTLYGLPGGNYTVTETNWNWAYNHKIEGGSSPNPCSITKKVDNPESKVTFPFSGEHKTGTGPEDMHNHDEEYKVNIIDVSTFPSPKASPLRKEEDYLFE